MQGPRRSGCQRLRGRARALTSARGSRFLPGVYSSPGNWHKIFGTGADSVISRTYEWIYGPETADLRHAPAGWCLRVKGSRCARFFGGVNSASRYALIWQFSGGGGVLNGYGDFDQIDRGRMR